MINDLRCIVAVSPGDNISNMNEDQLEIYYAMLESASSFRLGIEQLEQTDASNMQIRELTELHSQLEQVLSQAVPGEGGTASSVILETLAPIEDYIFQISSSLQNYDFYAVQPIHTALDTMYFALGSLTEMAKTYYPQVGGEQTETETKETTQPESVEVEQLLELEQALEQAEEDAKNIIDTTIESDLPNEEKKSNIDDALNEVGYAAVYSTLKKYKSYGYSDLSTNVEVQEACFKEVLDSFLEIVNESVLSKYLNQETLEADAKYVSDYFFNLLSNTLVEWE